MGCGILHPCSLRVGTLPYNAIRMEPPAFDAAISLVAAPPTVLGAGSRHEYHVHCARNALATWGFPHWGDRPEVCDVAPFMLNRRRVRTEPLPGAGFS